MKYETTNQVSKQHYRVYRIHKFIWNAIAVNDISICITQKKQKEQNLQAAFHLLFHNTNANCDLRDVSIIVVNIFRRHRNESLLLYNV